ncbi:hypothetical protein [Streptomyces millisiae]|uniref:Uncharacterized protein n=1 Tax=Streptomyces millisiae TaxID=3075542 RepID=A0ABU2LP08_9ACTN|nr:hypothetical protein [Streptomyces sp. DSM 44918]MDT0319315.1 hypothetical protein [Streptomyces sp. DSM 44918]
MASRHDRATQERRRRLRERQENERKEFRRRQQAQMAALNEIDGAVERFEAAHAAVAAALANAVQVFPSVEALAEVTAFDAKEIRAYERRHRREQQGAQRRPVGGEQVPQQASGEAEPVTVPTG